MTANLSVCILSIIVCLVGAVLTRDSKHQATPPDTASGIRLIGVVTFFFGLAWLCYGLGV